MELVTNATLIVAMQDNLRATVSGSPGFISLLFQCHLLVEKTTNMGCSHVVVSIANNDLLGGDDSYSKT